MVALRTRRQCGASCFVLRIQTVSSSYLFLAGTSNPALPRKFVATVVEDRHSNREVALRSECGQCGEEPPHQGNKPCTKDSASIALDEAPTHCEAPCGNSEMVPCRYRILPVAAVHGRERIGAMHLPIKFGSASQRVEIPTSATKLNGVASDSWEAAPWKPTQKWVGAIIKGPI